MEIIMLIAVVLFAKLMSMGGSDATITVGDLIATGKCGCVWTNNMPTTLCDYHRVHGARTPFPDEEIARLKGRLETVYKRATLKKVSLKRLTELDEQAKSLVAEIERVKREGV